MNEELHYSDLLKAHKFFYNIEERYHFYDAYMKATEPDAWFKSPKPPLVEGLLLFGWVQSWDPYFRGELALFLQTYEDIFDTIKSLETASLTQIQFSEDVRSAICLIFDSVANCSKKKRYERKRRYESTDTSKILHAIHPHLFVMWDSSIRNGIVEGQYDGSCYTNEFLPNMQLLAKHFLDSYIEENGGSYDDALTKIEEMAHRYTLAKLIDEFNYLRFTYKKTLSEIRNIGL
jgi:hypothetical protein